MEKVPEFKFSHSECNVMLRRYLGKTKTTDMHVDAIQYMLRYLKILFCLLSGYLLLLAGTFQKTNAKNSLKMVIHVTEILI